MLIQAVLQLLVYLLFHLMLFYVQLRISTDMQIPPELLLVPHCTAGYPYGSKSSVKGMPHPSQTISGSCSNISQSQLYHNFVMSCNSSFHEKNWADNWNWLHTTARSATCKATPYEIQPELVTRTGGQALIVAVTKVLFPKWEVLGCSYTSCQPNVKRHLCNCCWPL